jgi:uncharacterized membrane protein YcaP (DUF421 family)
MNALIEPINSVLGLHADSAALTFFQISLRGIIVFVVALVMLRLGDKRFLSNKTAFDAVLGFMLASMLARAVNGNCAFFPTLGGGFVLVGLHRLLAFLTRDNHRFGILVKGRAEQIIRDGSVQKQVLKSNNLSEHDLLEDLRLNGNTDEIARVKAAYYERDG